MPNVLKQLIIDYLPKQQIFLFDNIDQAKYQEIQQIINRSVKCAIVDASLCCYNDKLDIVSNTYSWGRDEINRLLYKFKKEFGNNEGLLNRVFDAIVKKYGYKIKWCKCKLFKPTLFNILSQSAAEGDHFRHLTRFIPRDTAVTKVSELKTRIKSLQDEIKKLNDDIKLIKKTDDFIFENWRCKIVK